MPTAGVSSARILASTTIVALAYILHMGSRISTQKYSGPAKHLTSGDPHADTRPISGVPDDILYLVFPFVAQAEPVRGILDPSQQMLKSDNPSYYECLGWMRLSAVCRQWRVVLLASAPLWADAVFQLPAEAASLALTRSSNAPLEMYIPSGHENHVVSSKDWGLPHTHRARLLSLGIAHASRVRKLDATDLTAQHYHDILRSGMFRSLRVLSLRCSYYDDSETPASMREDVGYLNIAAPKVYHASLSAALPIAQSGGPGLSFSLPALRTLSVSTTTSRPNNAGQLRWIPPLIRGAPGLQRLKLQFPVDFFINWKDLCGDEPFHLPALHAIELSGSLNAQLNVLFKQISVAHLPAVFSSSSGDMDRTNILDFLRIYGEIMAQSIAKYPLDTLYISRGTRKDFYAAFSVTAISSKEVPAPYNNSEDLMQSIRSRAHHAARLSTFFSWLIMGDEDRAGDALDVLAPLLARNSIKHLILDELSTTQWDVAVPGFMRSCLSKVTTLHCIDSHNTAGKQIDMYPCTAALRRLKIESGEQTGETNRTTASVSHLLPALETVVVSMETHPEEKYWTIRGRADVQEWWNELIRGLIYRRDTTGRRVRTLRIVGNCEPKKLHGRLAKLDAKMLVQATALVDELRDERFGNSDRT